MCSLAVGDNGHSSDLWPWLYEGGPGEIKWEGNPQQEKIFPWVHAPGCEIPEETGSSDIKAWTLSNIPQPTGQTKDNIIYYF